MNAIEFCCKVDKELSIHIPVEYVGLVDKVVRIIILTDDVEQETSKKDKLLHSLKLLQESSTFSELEDPEAWQKTLRNEWE